MENAKSQINIKQTVSFWLAWFFMIVAISVVVFLGIRGSVRPIADWDEARHGVNAYEMLRQHNYIANYYAGSLDYWNLKPPISYYSIMLGYKIFGYNAFGLRFFSALSCVLIAIIVSLFIKKRYGGGYSIASLLIFISFNFLFAGHCFLSGDADAIFLLFFTISIIAMMKTEDNPNWIYLSGLMFALCFLTKSWHAFVLVPTIFFYLVFTNGFKRLKWHRILIFFACSIAPILIWAIARFQFDGFKFFRLMFEYDLLNRTSNAIEGHLNPAPFYFLLLTWCSGSFFCLIFMAVGFYLKCAHKEKFSYVEIGCLCAMLSNLLLFTLSSTRLDWYVFPCFIPLLILACSGLSKLCKNSRWFLLVPMCVFLLVTIHTMPPVLQKKESTMQNFINSLDVQSAEIYMYGEGSWAQGDLLCAELKLDATCLSGGVPAFENNQDAFLILPNENLKEIEFEYVIVSQDANFSLIKHA